jgi:trans-aconitate 2-methyltransferase
MDWSASQYLQFEDERTRPARNLLAAVPNTSPRDVIDLGCGPGNSTQLLADCYPDANVTGMDSSPNMIAQARQAMPEARFELGNIDDWHPEHGYDVIFSNAVMQWLHNHETLFPRLVEHLNPGGTLAIQMPDNLAEPSHIAIREVARSGAWSDRMKAADDSHTDVLSTIEYYGALSGICSRVDIWRTVYNHPMQGADAIVDWFVGSRLRPYLAQLDADEKTEFLAQYRRLIEKSYPSQPDGRTLLAFPRLFIVATR